MTPLAGYIGAATIGLSVAQFALALGYFGLSARTKQALSKFHRPLGFAITVAGLSTILVRLTLYAAAVALLIGPLYRAAPPLAVFHSSVLFVLI